MTIESNIVQYVQGVIARAHGYFANFHGSQFTGSGTPDILSCVDGQFIGVEVKRHDDVPTVSQIRHGLSIVDSGGRFVVAYEDFSEADLRGDGATIEVLADENQFEVHERVISMRSTYSLVRKV